MSGEQVVASVDFYDWVVQVVSDDNTTEYRIVDPRGRTVARSENGYGNTASAMRDGLAHMFEMEARS